jgi:galactokinase
MDRRFRIFLDEVKAEKWVAHGPGRVNLIGEHTDYSEGFVFPAAIDRFVKVAAERSSDVTRLISEDKGEGVPFDVNAIDREAVKDSWTKYPAGVAWALGAKTNLAAGVASTLVAENGVSSSAALEMAFAVIWNEVDQLGHSNKELALLCQKAENEFVGMPCGVMDQMASAMGQRDHAMFLDTRSLEIEYAPIPKGIDLVICSTGKSRQLAGSEYRERREAVESAARKLGVKSLRDATMKMVESGDLSDVERRRARHVVTENKRCRDFAAALKKGKLDDLGRLMAESHESLRVDFEVSCPELDVMAEAARTAPGCLGARMTGAGFGGACVALVVHDQEIPFSKSTWKEFHSHYPKLLTEITFCRAAAGAGLVG